MKILHTSDWHAGKALFQRDRMPDLDFALEQMLQIIEEQSIDLVLVAGDLYDSFHPPTRAIEGLNKFFLQLFKRDVPAVIISGNHDSTHLWKSMRSLLSLASIHVFDKITLDNANLSLKLKGEDLHISCLPYPSERQLIGIGGQVRDMAEQRQSYADQVGLLMEILAESLPKDGFHILCAHLMLSGAEPTLSERALSLADTFAVLPQSFPEIYDYVALGHIHKRQKVKGSPVPAWFSGTPYQIDFGEAGMEKGVQIIDFQKGQKPGIEFIPLELLHPLQNVVCHEDDLETIYDTWQERPELLKLKVKLNAPRKGLADKIRAVFGAQLLRIELVTPEKRNLQPRYQNLALDNPLEVYKTYCSEANLPLDKELEQTFLALLEAIET